LDEQGRLISVRFATGAVSVYGEDHIHEYTAIVDPALVRRFVLALPAAYQHHPGKTTIGAQQAPALQVSNPQ
jgi:hypothetical protein